MFGDTDRIKRILLILAILAFCWITGWNPLHFLGSIAHWAAQMHNACHAKGCLNG